MKKNIYLLVPLFEKFVQDSYKGRRLKPNGSRIKSQTVDNYAYALRYLQEYENTLTEPLRVISQKSTNKRLFQQESRYWRNFYKGFTTYLYDQKGCFDNYVGNMIKIIRVFFNYLNRELGLHVGTHYQKFYVCREEIPIITLMPSQLSFLINDQFFDSQLSKPLRKAKEIFIFGCTVALRVSDIFSLGVHAIERQPQGTYLSVKTMKTGATIRVKLPGYAVGIIEKFSHLRKGRKTIFPAIPITRFNNQLKEIAARAGWTQLIGKQRSKRGKHVELIKQGKLSTSKDSFRFCDLVSSHTMRRTAITTMLMLGMKEQVVRKISGHAANSKSFYRYVNFVQSYLDLETDKVFDQLTTPQHSVA